MASNHSSEFSQFGRLEVSCQGQLVHVPCLSLLLMLCDHLLYWCLCPDSLLLKGLSSSSRTCVKAGEENQLHRLSSGHPTIIMTCVLAPPTHTSNFKRK